MQGSCSTGTHPRSPDTAQRAVLHGVVRCRAGAVTDARVWYDPGSAERHEKCRTASGTRWRAPQSLFSPCCHLRRCRPNQETMMAASRNGIMALEIAAPSPSWPAMIARWYDKVAIRCVAFTGPPLVIAQINWKSVKVNSTENVITTAMMGVSSG